MVHLYHNVVQMQPRPIGIRGSPYEEKLYELAQRRRLPCAVSTKSPRRLFIRQDEMEQWANVPSAMARIVLPRATMTWFRLPRWPSLGIVLVACLATRVPGVPWVTRTSTFVPILRGSLSPETRCGAPCPPAALAPLAAMQRQRRQAG
jgi:hypothetical protein